MLITGYVYNRIYNRSKVIQLCFSWPTPSNAAMFNVRQMLYLLHRSPLVAGRAKWIFLDQLPLPSFSVQPLPHVGKTYKKSSFRRLPPLEVIIALRSLTSAVLGYTLRPTKIRQSKHQSSKPIPAQFTRTNYKNSEREDSDNNMVNQCFFRNIYTREVQIINFRHRVEWLTVGGQQGVRPNMNFGKLTNFWNIHKKYLATHWNFQTLLQLNHYV